MRSKRGDYRGKHSALRDLEVNVRSRWYVIANRVQALIYEDTQDSDFLFVKRLSNPKGRKTESQWVSDRPGRVISGAGGRKHGLNDTKIHHEQTAKLFAKKIGVLLNQARLKQRFDELVLVAEPHFLGFLRTGLNASVKKMIKTEVGRELGEGSDKMIHTKVLQAIQKQVKN